MPNQNTFSIKPIRELIERYIDGKKYMFMTFENGDGSNLYVFEQ